MTNLQETKAGWHKVGKYQFVAEPFHCDINDRLFMVHQEFGVIDIINVVVEDNKPPL